MALTKIKGAGINISAAEKLYFDGGGTTYIQESADGVLDFYADNVKMLELLEGGTDYVWVPVDATKFAIGAGKDLNIYTSSDDAIIENITSDKDIIFKGNDGGSTITALTLDISAAGAATFNDKIIATELDISGNMDIDGTSNLDVVDIDGAVDMASTLTVAGVVDVAEYIKHTGDADTSIRFSANDAIEITAGNVKMMRFLEDDSQDMVVINEDSADIDFRVESNNNANMLFVDGGNDRVGIGTSPSRLFQLHSGGSGDTCYMQFTQDGTGATSGDGLLIGINANEQAIIYNQENTDLILYTNQVERMNIGNDGVIETSGDFKPGADVIMASGRGISFAATADSSGSMSNELLDDYEEGTFTVGWAGASMSSIGNSTAYYTKIGDIVYFQYYNNGMTIGSASANATITGLPFTSSSASESFATVNLQYANAVDGSSSGGHIGNNSTQLTFTDEGGATYSTFIDGSGKKLMVSGTYKV